MSNALPALAASEAAASLSPLPGLRDISTSCTSSLSPLPGLRDISTSSLNLIEKDGGLQYVPQFLEPAEHQAYFEALLQLLDWQQEFLSIYGRKVPVPRLVAWYGDPAAVYTYSKIRHEPLPWLPVLTELNKRIESYCGRAFNSVLANLYRDGADHMGWHADAEPELGLQPYIASLSLGATRLFKIKHKKFSAKSSPNPDSDATSRSYLNLELAGGSLLLMSGNLQKHWRHSLAKTCKPVAPRINLTYRWVGALNA